MSFLSIFFLATVESLLPPNEQIFLGYPDLSFLPTIYPIIPHSTFNYNSFPIKRLQFYILQSFFINLSTSIPCK